MKKRLFARRLTAVAALLSLATLVSAQLNLTLLAHMPNDSNVSLAGCRHYVDSSGLEYALIGTSRGLDIWDLTVPTSPIRRFQVQSPASNWREVKVYAGFAYVGSEAAGSGITIVDLRSLPDTIYTRVYFGDGPLDGLIQKSHTVLAYEGYLYVFGSTAPHHGAIICSLDDPWNPHFVGEYLTNYIHDGYVRGDTLWGSEIYAGQYSVIDISAPSSPQLMATQATPGLFNHNTELSDNSRYLFTTDEKQYAPLGSFDVNEIGDMRLLDVYYPSQKPQHEVHNVRVFNDFLINPSYGGQLTIVDAAQPDNLIETAWYVMGNSLIWDADPYLPSGVIFATAKNEGVFVFQPHYQRASYLRGIVTDAATGLPLNGAKVFLLETINADTTDESGDYATGNALPGNYTVRIERTGYYTQEIQGVTLTTGETALLNIALVPEPISTDEIENAADFRVQPTLVTDGRLRFSCKTTVRNIQLLRNDGQLMATTLPDFGQTEWTLPPGLQPGMYVVRAVTDQGAVSREIIVLKSE